MAVDTLELYGARHAWDAAGVPLPLEAVGQYTPITSRPDGSETLMETAVFEPLRIEFNMPELPDNASENEWENATARSVARSVDFSELRKRWLTGVFMKSVLDVNHGNAGSRVFTHIFGEFVYMSALQHRATVAYAAGRFCVFDRARAPETIVSVWDYGDEYSSAADLRRIWTKDRFGDLDEPGLTLKRPPQEILGQASSVLPATVIATDVALVFGGRLTVISGDNRLDISRKGESDFNIVQSTSPPIIGNLMVAHLPHIPYVPKSLRSGGPQAKAI